jgi:hypothetical protein
MTKNLALVSVLFAATLAACGEVVLHLHLHLHPPLGLHWT